MDNFEYNSPLSELQTSTESDLISEFVTTMVPWHIEMTDKIAELSTEELDGMHVLYGLGGILIFFVIYMICYSYFAYIKEKEENKDIELRLLNRRISHVSSHSPPMNQRRIFIEDYDVPVNPNAILPRQLNGNSHSVENTNKTQGENKVFMRSVESSKNTFRSPNEILQRKFPDDYKGTLDINTTADEVSQCSLGIFDNILSRMSTPPLCFSSPRESKERLFYPEDFQDLLYSNTSQIAKCEILEDPKSEEYSTTLLKRCNVSQSASPTGQSRSSPTSPDIVRRRLSTIEGTPRRPSSWR